MRLEVVNIKTIKNEALGSLSFFESNREIPFDVKRVYYTYDVPVNIKRGMHAHKNLDQMLWCPYGSIEVILDDGYSKELIKLDSPDKGLIVRKGMWHDMYWRKEGSVLCVVASDYFAENDYIRSYDEFIKYIEKGYWRDENKF